MLFHFLLGCHGYLFFYEVSFGDLCCVLMWVVVSTGSMSMGLNLLDNGIGSFIRVFFLFSLDFSFSLLRVFFS